jgi:hypothetical protein
VGGSVVALCISRNNRPVLGAGRNSTSLRSFEDFRRNILRSAHAHTRLVKQVFVSPVVAAEMDAASEANRALDRMLGSKNPLPMIEAMLNRLADNVAALAPVRPTNANPHLAGIAASARALTPDADLTKPS